MLKIITLLLLLLCNPLSAVAQKIIILSSISTYNQIAEQIGGNLVETSYLATGAGQDPHDFTPTVSTIKKIHEANIIISNGLQVDSWLLNITQNTKNKILIVAEDLVQNLPGQNLYDWDQHLWYSPELIIKMAKYLTQILSEQNPRDQAYFAANLQKFTAKYNEYIKFLDKIKSHYRNIKIAAPESFFNNLARYLKFNIFTKEVQNATKKDLSASPRALAQFISLMKNHKVDLFLYNKEVSNKSILDLKRYAEKYKIPVVTLQEIQPLNIDYFSWQKAQILKIIKSIDHDRT